MIPFVMAHDLFIHSLEEFSFVVLLKHVTQVKDFVLSEYRGIAERMHVVDEIIYCSVADFIVVLLIQSYCLRVLEAVDDLW